MCTLSMHVNTKQLNGAPLKSTFEDKLTAVNYCTNILYTQFILDTNVSSQAISCSGVVHLLVDPLDGAGVPK